MSVIALICARSGSKRFPNKPMQEIGGKTLVEIAYDKASKTESITHINIIGDAVRPPELCGDDVPKWHVWRWFAQTHARPDDILVDIDICRPFSTVEEIDEVVALCESSGFQAMSMAPSRRNPYQDILEIDDWNAGWISKEPAAYLSADAPPTYDHGGVVAMRASDLPYGKKHGKWHPMELGYQAVIVPPRNVLDINTPEDLEYCRWLASYSETHSSRTSSRPTSSSPQTLSSEGPCRWSGPTILCQAEPLSSQGQGQA